MRDNDQQYQKLITAGWKCNFWGPGGAKARERWTHPEHTPPDLEGYQVTLPRHAALKLTDVNVG